MHFEGVLGLIAKLSFFDDSCDKNLYFRPDSYEVLKRWTTKFQVVLVGRSRESHMKVAEKHLERRGVFLDAIYTKTREWRSDRVFYHYT